MGASFHQPYPGSALKDFSRVLTQVEGQRLGGSPSAPVATLTTDQAWFDRVVDREANTPEYRALLADLPTGSTSSASTTTTRAARTSTSGATG